MIYHYKLPGVLVVLLSMASMTVCAAMIDNANAVNAEQRDATPDEKQVAPSIIHEESAKTRSVQIRVLLDCARDDEPYPSWRIMAKKGFVVLDQHDARHSLKYMDESLVLHHKNGAWYLNDKKMNTDRLLIRPNEGSIMVDGVPYYGSLFIVIEPHRLLLINCLDLEDYVFSVVVAEGLPNWSLEMNKVQAIAVRTYAAKRIYQTAGKKELYHIKNTNVHQVYNGKPSSAALRAAVDQTRGIILTYDDEPIIAMYDICCGGIVPANMRGIDFKEAPYLARTKACTFCKNSKVYQWHVSYTKKEFETIIKNVCPHIGTVRSVSVIRKDKAGLVREVEVVGRGGVYQLKGQKIYSLVRGVKSFCFTIETSPKRVILKGRGYGHHTGLCQCGANEMVRQGFDHRHVLQFYYPGTRFMKIKEKVA